MDLLKFSRAMRAHGFRYRRARKDVGQFVVTRLIAGREAHYSVWVSLRAYSLAVDDADRRALVIFRDAEARFAQLEAGR